MITKNYVVNRDEVCVGVVGEFALGNADIYKKYIKSGKVFVPEYKYCRSMLFVPEANVLTKDLLYNTPMYPLFGDFDMDNCYDSQKNGCFSTSSRTTLGVKEFYNLSLLLQYFDYPEQLTYEDILLIRKTFFDGNFVKDVCDLFGYKKGRFCYEFVGEGVLPKEYWDVLNRLGDKSLFDSFFEPVARVDAFAPVKTEGKLRKLSKVA